MLRCNVDDDGSLNNLINNVIIIIKSITTSNIIKLLNIINILVITFCNILYVFGLE